MNVRRRLFFQFGIQLVVVGAVLLALFVAIIFFVAMQIIEGDYNRAFARSGLSGMMRALQVKDGKAYIEDEMLTKIKNSGGWLQVVNERGEATISYYVPDDVPARYGPGELTAYWQGQKPFPYSLYVLIQEKHGVTYTLLYGVKYVDDRILTHVKREATFDEGKLRLTDALRREISDHAASLQILDEHGSVLAAFNASPQLPSQYSVPELMMRAKDEETSRQRLAFDYDEKRNITWVVSVPYGDQTVGQPAESGIPPELKYLLWGLGLLFAGIMLIFMILSFWYGHRFGTPMLHMMDWLRNLGNGVYDEPTDRHGMPRSQTRKGRWKRKYRAYTEMIYSLRQLTSALKMSNEIRLKLEKSREAWIAGVSHDLKTPLSSISGYAHMLEAETYEWSQTEVRQFAAVMKEKAEYMDQLINDLSLTYRLSNDALPLQREITDMNEFIRQSVEGFRSDPIYREAQLTWEEYAEPIRYPIDRSWFRRILDNLLANAILHNPHGTSVRVILRKHSGENGDKGSFAIEIQDDGEGMDAETMDQLFERYYRGTNTEGNGKGTGLGMAIARQLAQAHGGRIEVDSRPGAGTTVRIIFNNL